MIRDSSLATDQFELSALGEEVDGLKQSHQGDVQHLEEREISPRTDQCPESNMKLAWLTCKGASNPAEPMAVRLQRRDAAGLESVRTTAKLAGLKLKQIDVMTAFLNCELEDDVYMRQRQRFISEVQENLVCSRLETVATQLNCIIRYVEMAKFVRADSDPCPQRSRRRDSPGSTLMKLSWLEE